MKIIDFILNKLYTDKLDEYLKPFGNIKRNKNDVVWVYIYNKNQVKNYSQLKAVMVLGD